MHRLSRALVAVSIAGTSAALVTSCSSFGEDVPAPASPPGEGGAEAATPPPTTDVAPDAGVVPPVQKCRGEMFAPPTRVNQTVLSAVKSIRIGPSGTTAWVTGTPSSGPSSTFSIVNVTFDATMGNVGSVTRTIGDGAFESAQGMSTPDDAFVVFQSNRPSSAAPQTKRLWMQSTAPASEAVEIDYASGTDLQDPYIVGSHIYFVEGGKVRVGELITAGVKPRIDNARDALSVASADHPVVSADELEMFYTSSDGALHRTTRATNAAFAAGPALTGQNGVGYPSYLTAEGCVLYFTSGNLPFRSFRLPGN